MLATVHSFCNENAFQLRAHFILKIGSSRSSATCYIFASWYQIGSVNKKLTFPVQITIFQ